MILMPWHKKKKPSVTRAGFVDPLSLIAIGFLVVTLVVGVTVTNDKSRSFLLESWARVSYEANVNKAERRAKREGGKKWEVANSGGKQCVGSECIAIVQNTDRNDKNDVVLPGDNKLVVSTEYQDAVDKAEKKAGGVKEVDAFKSCQIDGGTWKNDSCRFEEQKGTVEQTGEKDASTNELTEKQKRLEQQTLSEEPVVQQNTDQTLDEQRSRGIAQIEEKKQTITDIPLVKLTSGLTLTPEQQRLLDIREPVKQPELAEEEKKDLYEGLADFGITEYDSGQGGLFPEGELFQGDELFPEDESLFPKDEGVVLPDKGLLPPGYKEKQEITYSFGRCNEKQTSGETQKCNENMSKIYNAPLIGQYIQAYAPQNVQLSWKEAGFSSASECQKDMVEKGHGRHGASSCNTYAPTKEQATSSIALGSTITSIGAGVVALPAIVTAGAAGGTAGALAAGGKVLVTFGATSMMTQTSRAASAWVEDPWEGIDPEKNLAENLTEFGSNRAVQETGWTLLSFGNAWSVDILMKARVLGAPVAIKAAQKLNTAVSVLNLGVDIPYAINDCSREDSTASSCAVSWGAVGADIAFGTLDFFQGDLIWGRKLNIPDSGGTRIATPDDLRKLGIDVPDPNGSRIDTSPVEKALVSDSPTTEVKKVVDNMLDDIVGSPARSLSDDGGLDAKPVVKTVGVDVPIVGSTSTKPTVFENLRDSAKWRGFRDPVTGKLQIPIGKKPSAPIDIVTNTVDQALTNATTCRGGLCGESADLIKHVSEQHGLTANTYQVAEINQKRDVGGGFTHFISVVEDTKGNRYLVDQTFSQFDEIIKTNPDSPIVKDLLDKGYVPLTEDNLNKYLQLTNNNSTKQVPLSILDDVQSYPMNARPEVIQEYLGNIPSTSTQSTGLAKVGDDVGKWWTNNIVDEDGIFLPKLYKDSPGINKDTGLARTEVDDFVETSIDQRILTEDQIKQTAQRIENEQGLGQVDVPESRLTQVIDSFSDPTLPNHITIKQTGEQINKYSWRDGEIQTSSNFDGVTVDNPFTGKPVSIKTGETHSLFGTPVRLDNDNLVMVSWRDGNLEADVTLLSEKPRSLFSRIVAPIADRLAASKTTNNIARTADGISGQDEIVVRLLNNGHSPEGISGGMVRNVRDEAIEKAISLKTSPLAKARDNFDTKVVVPLEKLLFKNDVRLSDTSSKKHPCKRSKNCS